MKKQLLALMLLSAMTLTIGACKKNNPSSSTSSPSISTSTSDSSSTGSQSSDTSSDTSSQSDDSSSQSDSESSSSSSSSEERIEVTETEKSAAIARITEAFNELDIDEYAKSRWSLLVEQLNVAIASIREATYKDEVDAIVDSTLELFSSTLTMTECLEGTIFETYSGNYEFDRDDQNHLLIQYSDYPGYWVWCGTSNLECNVNTGNIFYLEFRNNKDVDIKVCLQLTDASGAYKVDSHTTNVAANETKKITLPIEVNVSKLYFFVDSTEEHHRAGEIAILSYGWDYEEREQDELPETKTINMNNTPINKAEEGVEAKVATYTLTESNSPYFISRVSAKLNVNFNGNGNSLRWFGLHLSAGGNKISLSDSQGYAQESSDGETIIFNLEIDPSKKLNVGSVIQMDMSYNAAGLTFEVVNFKLYYSSWASVTTETVNVGATIYEASASTGEYEVPYSSFTKLGKVVKMDVQFTTINTESYGKSQVYIKGFNFTDFSSGNNNVLNIAPIMDKSNPNPVTGTMTIYPTVDINLKSGGNITFTCWWASASNIVVDSITMYTESEAEPLPVTNLESHGIDGAVVLTWDEGKNATSYNVYQDGTKVDTVTSTYATITGLTNEQEYTFEVEAKNSKGVADKVSVKGTPTTSGDYDVTIDGLNTDLERLIGYGKMQSLFNNSFEYKGNNKRIKDTLSAMKSGQSQTIAYFGGSITVGENATLRDEHSHQKGYAYYSYQWIKEHYDTNNNSKFHNASISGTGSEIGIVRAQKDLYAQNPNLVFIEFAGNNANDPFYRDTFEALTRTCLELPSHPGIIFNISAAIYTGGPVVDYIVAIAKHYGIPVCSLDAGLKSICKVDSNNHLTREDEIFNTFISDGTHPNDEGHQLYAKVIANFIRSLDKDPEDSAIGVPSEYKYSNRFMGLTPVDSTLNAGIITDLGSWAGGNTSTTCTSKQSDVTAFQQGWKKTSTTENEPMQISVNCKNFIIIYCAANPSVPEDPKGTIRVTYTNASDPSDTETIEWDMTKVRGSSNGWDNPVAMLIIDKATASNYNISICFTETSGTGNIFAFGYSA